MKSQAEMDKIIFLFAVSFLAIFFLFTVVVDNTNKGNGNTTNYVEECKPFFLNDTTCPLDKPEQDNSSLNSSQGVGNSG